jgi:hypothetical protein
LRALSGRVQAQLAALVDDSTLSVDRQDGELDTVRTLVFEADHRCEIVVRTPSTDGRSVRFHTDSRTAVDITVSQAGKDDVTWIRSTEPAAIRRVGSGPLRVVYHIPDAKGALRRYQTEWVLI